MEMFPSANTPAQSRQKEIRGSLLLLLAAVIWGSAFAAQRAGMDHISPFTFTAIRTTLGGLFMAFAAAFSERKAGPEKKCDPKLQRKAGLLCGLFLFAATTLQQLGLVSTSAGKAGFLTALYVVLVPVAGLLFFRRNPGKIIWLSVALAVAALFLLCVPAGPFRVESSDLMLIGCAVCFTGQILCVGRYSMRVNSMALVRDQSLLTGALSAAIALLTEPIDPQGIREALFPILYTGIMSSGVGYTLQALAQRDVRPTIASLLMCLEAVFAVLTGVVLLGERMTVREGFGCLLMFTAVILAQTAPLLAGKIGRKNHQSKPGA